MADAVTVPLTMWSGSEMVTVGSALVQPNGTIEGRIDHTPEGLRVRDILGDEQILSVNISLGYVAGNKRKGRNG